MPATSHTTRPRLKAIWLLAATLLLPGCSQAPRDPIRIGINAWPGYEFIYLAQEMGFYREAGLESRVIEFSSLADCRRAYERGQLDVFGATVVEVLQASDQSARTPQIIQIVDCSHGADVILAQPGITNAAALRRKKIGVELASLGVYILARGLEMHGLDLTDVEVVSMDQQSMLNAFRHQELHAIVTYPPFSIQLERDQSGRRVFSTAEIPGEVLDIIAADSKVIRDRPDDIARFIRAYQQAIAYARDHPTAAYGIMARREGITPDEFAHALSDGIRLLTAADQAEYLRPQGRLTPVIERTDQILRRTRQIAGPDRRSQVVRPFLAATESGSPP